MTRRRTHAAFFLMVSTLAVAACGTAPEGEDLGQSEGKISGRVAPINRLLDDANVEGDQQVTVAQVQAFLVSKGSALASYQEGGRSAAQWIVDESRAERISPVYMLARLETESSIVRSGTLSKIAQATGCGCPDGAQCNPAFANFGPQVRCASQLMRGYFRSLDSVGETISGWRVGVGRSTSDPCWVTPSNRATAALYTYTPWVGAYGVGCGTTQWGGSSLVAALYNEFQPYFGAPSGPPPASACDFGDGLYCGGNGTAGDPLALYACSGGAATLQRTCALGCERKPAGQNDACVGGTACPFGDGLYCGGNGVGGAPSMLYACAAGKLTPQTVCANGCRRMAAGKNDACQ